MFPALDRADVSGALDPYRKPPSRRVYIPKAAGRQRPLAVAAVEDKIVQGAAAMVLNAIYEVDFFGFSYGFRPGRGQHDALDALVVGISSLGFKWGCVDRPVGRGWKGEMKCRVVAEAGGAEDATELREVNVSGCAAFALQSSVSLPSFRTASLM
jgi:hypothetical protein